MFPSDNSSEISYIPFDNKAATTEDIIQFIIQSMENNNNECDIFVADDKLIDANEWLTQISGIEQIKCEYRRVKDGYNMVITYDCWDNYAIMKEHICVGQFVWLNHCSLNYYFIIKN